MTDCWLERADAIRALAERLADEVAVATGARRRALQAALARVITLGVEARERARARE
ncbi:hypothetical protein [Sandaracinus amylolyticus]|uniref:Uncharacterized protein n=1 Tax=Sandaracinus amylolyticus TaxID=927083 RepID=A0A0F6YLT6_9BACT|nr:hypothetical protein [Sandaracinus amylolyticus]AKF08628.1 hypothetical protein DB32_005777 [Sandaracinus amylolyticus]